MKYLIVWGDGTVFELKELKEAVKDLIKVREVANVIRFSDGKYQRLVIDAQSDEGQWRDID